MNGISLNQFSLKNHIANRSWPYKLLLQLTKARSAVAEGEGVELGWEGRGVGAQGTRPSHAG